MVEKNKIKAVLSDGGHILYDESEHKNAFLSYLADLKERGFEKTVASIDVNKFRKVYAENKLRAYQEPSYDRSRAYRDTLDQIGVGELFDPLMSWIKQRKKVKKKLNPYVKETVQKLQKKGIDFIVLSDAFRSGEELREKLSNMGLNEGVTDVISSKDLGYCKPDKRFFDYALKKYGLRREEVVFVAHDLDELEGAHKLGLPTVALNYDLKDLPYMGYSTKINNFGDLIDLVEKYSPDKKNSSAKKRNKK